MDAREFIKQKFREFYASGGIVAPSELAQREFGFGDEKKIDYRHFAFRTEQQLKQHFVEKVPLYASFSSAYYEFPDARPMPKKNFFGADLIFEFDAECTHDTLTCLKCLDKTKQETFKLINDFLVPDFGISKKDIHVAFSGNRGYHIHVRNSAVRDLDQNARREIIDYVQARDIDISTLMRGATPSLKGWKGKLARILLEYAKNPESAPETLQKHIEGREQEVINGIMHGNYDLFRDANRICKRILSQRIVHLSAEIDQSVTFDMARLIRMPSTLHGGTGLICDYVNDLEKFNPFKDAVVFGDSSAKVKATKDVSSFMLHGQSFGPLAKDEEAELPEYAAIFLMCKGVATPA